MNLPINEYRELAQKFFNDAAYMLSNGIVLYAKAEEYEAASDAIRQLISELKLCQNELCLKCGDYKMAHKGACDGCRWKDVESL